MLLRLLVIQIVQHGMLFRLGNVSSPVSFPALDQVQNQSIRLHGPAEGRRLSAQLIQRARSGRSEWRGSGIAARSSCDSKAAEGKRWTICFAYALKSCKWNRLTHPPIAEYINLCCQSDVHNFLPAIVCWSPGAGFWDSTLTTERYSYIWPSDRYRSVWDSSFGVSKLKFMEICSTQ